MGFSSRSPTYLVFTVPLKKLEVQWLRFKISGLHEPLLQEESQVTDRMSYGSLHPCLLISINLGSQTTHSADLQGWRGNSKKPANELWFDYDHGWKKFWTYQIRLEDVRTYADPLLGWRTESEFPLDQEDKGRKVVPILQPLQRWRF